MSTLFKIEWAGDINNLVEFINRNFALIENNPLYKGISGKAGEDGENGIQGIRGSNFFFVIFENFNQQFPGELSTSSQITQEFINYKLLVYEEKEKLLKALETEFLVDNDIIVLSNSMMLSYDLKNNMTVDTGLAFNPNSNLAGDIRREIEEYIKWVIENDPTINSLHNVILPFNTLAKNYTDTNSVFITNKQTSSSVYVPYLPNYTNPIGISIPNHKYFGYNEDDFPKSNNGTIVFGSLKKYIDLITTTVSSTQKETLSSDYAPGENNIPSIVFLQDTPNNGLLFGLKTKSNLKSFGSIYKDYSDNIVIKSDSGVNNIDFSKLLIHKRYLEFDKQVNFKDNLDVTKNFTLQGNILSNFLTSAQYADSGDDSKLLNIGYRFNEGKLATTQIISEFIKFNKYVKNVLIVDDNGLISKSYELETIELSNNDLIGQTPITNYPNSKYKILTSNYFGWLAQKINNSNEFTQTNYWLKSEYYPSNNIPVIPDIWIKNRLRVSNDIIFGGGNNSIPTNSSFLSSNNTNKILNIGFSESNSKLIIDSNNIQFIYNNGSNTKFGNKVLVTDTTGYLLDTKYIDSTNIDTALTNSNFDRTMDVAEISTTSSNNGLSTIKQIIDLISTINDTRLWSNFNVWRKSQWETNEINNLFLNEKLKIGNELIIFDAISNEHQIDGNNLMFKTLNVEFFNQNIKFKNFVNNILITDNNGLVLSTYSLDNTNYPEWLGNSKLPSVSNRPTSTTKVALSWHIDWLAKKIDSMLIFNQSLEGYWSKPEFESNVIPKLVVKNDITITGQSFTVGNGLLKTGTITNGNYVLIGTLDFRLPGFANVGGKTTVLTVNTEGKVSNQSTICLDENNEYKADVPRSTTDTSINSGLISENDRDISTTSILTGKEQGWFIRLFNNIKTRLANTYNKQETDAKISDTIPVGCIMMWDLAFGPIPYGWQAISNGARLKNSDGSDYIRTHNNLPYDMPSNIVGRYPKISDIRSGAVGNATNNEIMLNKFNVAPHNHSVDGVVGRFEKKVFDHKHTSPPHSHQIDTRKGTSSGGIGSANGSLLGDFIKSRDHVVEISYEKFPGEIDINVTGNTIDNIRADEQQSINIEPAGYELIYIMKIKVI